LDYMIIKMRYYSIILKKIKKSIVFSLIKNYNVKS